MLFEPGLKPIIKWIVIQAVFQITDLSIGPVLFTVSSLVVWSGIAETLGVMENVNRQPPATCPASSN